jgi:DNA-binding MarR family transcriptional regulator
MEAATKAQPAPAITAADRELGYRLGAVMLKCLGADGGAAIRAIDDSGLTFTQMKVLLTLSGERSDPPTVKLVADQLGLSLPSVSRAVDGLVRRGLVSRTEDDHDRRMRRLSPTAQGQGLSDEILAARLDGLGKFAASLTEAERELLEPALEQLLEREELQDIYRKYRKGARR